MRLLFKSGKKQPGIQAGVPKLDKRLLERILDFAHGVEPLHTPADIQIRLFAGNGMRAGRQHGAASTYYLLVYSDDLPHAYMNAGYIAGQILAYLCFLGIPAVLSHSVPVWAKEEQGYECLTAVAFGESLPAGRCQKRADSEELPCVYHDYHERWSEEVLRYVKKRFPTALRAVRAVHEDGRICIVPKVASGRKTSLAELEAGIAAARIMTAAEELWMDLAFVDADGSRCLVSVCRRKDLERLCTRVQEKTAVGRKAVPSYS